MRRTRYTLRILSLSSSNDSRDAWGRERELWPVPQSFFCVPGELRPDDVTGAHRPPVFTSVEDYALRISAAWDLQKPGQEQVRKPLKLTSLFGSTYVWEQAFSLMTLNKNRLWSATTDITMRGALKATRCFRWASWTKITPRTNVTATPKRPLLQDIREAKKKVLEQGLKYAIQPVLKPVVKVALVRHIVSKAPEEKATQIINEGIDCLASLRSPVHRHMSFGPTVRELQMKYLKLYAW